MTSPKGSSKDIPPLAHTKAASLASRKFHLALERVGDVGRKRKVEQSESDAIVKKPCLLQSKLDSVQFDWESFLMPEVPHNAVHHFWVSLEQGKNLFDNPKKSCLASFSDFGYAQVIWTWEAIQFGDIDGVRVCSLESLFPWRFGEMLLSYGMAVECLKDLVELAVLYKYGGIFTDFDYLALTAELPSPYFFATEGDRALPTTLRKN